MKVFLLPYPLFFDIVGTIETTSSRQKGDFEGIAGTSPEWPTLPPVQPVKKTSTGLPPSAWSRPIQTQWQKQSGVNTVSNQQPSRPPQTHTQSVSSDVPAEEQQSHPVHTQQPSDPSGSNFSLLESSSDLVNHQLLEHPQHMPCLVEPENPSFLSSYLTALLSKELSMRNKFDPFQTSPRSREQVLIRENNMVIII